MSLTLEQALKVLDGARTKAKALNIRCAFVVLDAGAEVVALQKMDGARFTAAEFARRKAFTALNWARPTHETAERFQPMEFQVLLTLADPRIMFNKGGVPIMSGGQVIGAIGTSGGSGDQDLQCSEAGVAAL
jgi:uncharacterized protein GlcG (DUF336 family)